MKEHVRLTVFRVIFFNNEEFLEFNKEMYIEVYTDVAKEDHIVKGKGDKLGIVDTCIRTI